MQQYWAGNDPPKKAPHYRCRNELDKIQQNFIISNESSDLLFFRSYS